MAKAREAERTRDRIPPPPRMTGVGLSQIALFGGLVAILMSFLGVFMAAGSTDPNIEKRADAFGSVLCAALTAPEPEWWGTTHGSSSEAKAFLRSFYKELQLGKIEKRLRIKLGNQDYRRSERNKRRIERIEAAVGSLGAGVVRGLKLSFSDPRIHNQSTGARIKPEKIDFRKQIGQTGIRVGSTVANSSTSGNFRARVYHRDYKNALGVKVGDAYVILSQSTLQAKQGAGMWLLLTPLLVAVAVALVIVQANNAAAGMKNLARDLETIGRGKLDLRVHTSGSGEIGFLQRTAERMTRNLGLIQSTGSTDLDEAIEKEMDLANEIHQSLRPSEPPRLPGFELETLFRSGSEIGGDYFDYIELDENRTALVIADCSESLRGVPAAMVMAMTRAYLKAAVDPKSGPVDWLQWVNRRLARDLKSGMAVTALVAVVDTTKGEITAASAGHRPIVLWRKGKTALINPNGIALGLDVGPIFDKTIEEKRFMMHKNDRIVLYTDGFVSAENDAGEPYGEERFLDSVRRQGAMNSAAFVNFVAGGVDKFLDGRELTDDITISTLKKMK